MRVKNYWNLYFEVLQFWKVLGALSDSSGEDPRKNLCGSGERRKGLIIV